MYGPNNEGLPSARLAERAAALTNHLHFNPYPNTAAPGPAAASARPGNEHYATTDSTTIGNPTGNQGTKTDGQVKKK